MLQDLIGLLPEKVNGVAPAVAFGLAGAGALLSLCGARFSRSLLTLVMVAVGTFVGMRLPRWVGWGIDPMGPAFGGAVVLGLCGYVFHRTLEGILLGLLLAAGAGAATWVTLAPGATWQWPGLEWSGGAAACLTKIWQSLPTGLSRTFPTALAIGLGTGGILAAIWPKLGRVLLYSLGGVTLFVVAGSIGVMRVRPQWITELPADSARQMGIFSAIFMLCAGVQWLSQPRMAKVRAADKSEKDFVASQVKHRSVRQLSLAPDLSRLSPGAERQESASPHGRASIA
ncbi:MAG: hypothetical protein JWL69_1802 [Phycisphaerales bacterium]|nr:hypothetical protein [Phycisphaerales bacterium]